MEKRCNRCLESKECSEFFKNPSKNNPLRLRSLCKVCCKKANNLWMTNNRDKYNAIHRTVRKRKLSYYRNRGIELARQRRISHPWEQSFYMAKDRCTNSKRRSFRSYGARGIKFELSLDDIRMLWFRDNAHLLVKPSIDRIDTYGNYSLGNCRFIEMRENNARPKRKRLKEKAYDAPTPSEISL